MQKANEAFLRGEEYTPQGKPITDYPQGFKDFVRDNADRIAVSRSRGTEPYFVRNNAEVVDRLMKDDVANPSSSQLGLPQNKPSIQELAKERHAARTPEQIADIKERWQLSRMSAALDEINIEWDESLNALAYGRAVGTTSKEQLSNYLRALKVLSGEDSLLLSDGKRRGISISLHDAADYLSQGLYSDAKYTDLLITVDSYMEVSFLLPMYSDLTSCHQMGT